MVRYQIVLKVFFGNVLPPSPVNTSFRVYFNVQFYTKSAVLNPFVQLLKHKCAVTLNGLLI